MMMVVAMMVMVMAMMVMVAIILSNASHMVVVANLRQAHCFFKSRQPHPVLAEFAIHIRAAFRRLFRSFDKDIEEKGMRIEVVGAKKVRIRVICGEFQGLTSNSFFQYARKQEKRKDDDALEPHAMTARQSIGQQRRGDADIARRAPAKSHAFPQQAGQFLHIGVGVGIAAAPPHGQKQCVFTVNRRRARLGLGDFQAAQLNDIRV